MKAIPYVVKEYVIDHRQGQNFVNLPSEGKILTAELQDNQLILYLSLPEWAAEKSYEIKMYPFLVLPTDTSFDGWLNSKVEWHYITTFRKDGKTMHLFFEGERLKR